MRRARFAALIAAALLWACDGSGRVPDRSPVGPPVSSRTVIVHFRSVFPGEARCGSAALAGGGGFACAGDSLIVRDVAAPAELVAEDPSLVRYVEPAVLGDSVTAWLLGREQAAVLVYAQELVNASGSRPFPFGFRESPVAVDLEGLEPAQAAAGREVVQRLDSSLAPLLGSVYFELVEQRRAGGVRAFTLPLTPGPARTFAEIFDAAHKILCRIELDSDLPPGAALSSGIAHELGHCLGLTRHDPDDRPDRIMNRLAPAEYWTESNGLNEFDARVFALAVLTSRNEIDLTNFR
jgi:hypothetical protein